jgi:hypothetical protein
LDAPVIDVEKVAETLFADDLSESAYLTAYTVSKLLENKECDVLMASAFILHGVVSKHISLSQRRFPLVVFEGMVDEDTTVEQSIGDYLSNFSVTARDVLRNQKWNDAMAEREVRELEDTTLHHCLTLWAESKIMRQC